MRSPVQFPPYADVTLGSTFLQIYTQRCQVDAMVQSTSWELLIPTSYKITAYIPSLKATVTAGSFVRYKGIVEGEEEADDGSYYTSSSTRVGRIVDVVTSLDLVPSEKRHQLSNNALAPQQDIEIPIQYVMINYFQDRKSLPDDRFPSPFEDNSRYDTGWQKIVQSDISEWIPSYFIEGLAFIAFEDDDANFDDCKGMCHFFVGKYRIESGTGVVSLIPKHTCPPFAGQVVWSGRGAAG